MPPSAYAEGSREPLTAALGIALWLAWALILFGGFAVGRPSDDNPQRIPRLARLASSVVLVIAAWTFALLSDEEGTTFRALIAIGMTLGLLGDWRLAGAHGKPERVLQGMLAFGAGHVAYILGFRDLSPDALWSPVVLMWLVAAMCWFIVVLRPAHPRTPLHWFALPYALLLATTVGAAAGAALALGQMRAWLPVIGAALFLLSDLVLAAELFNGLTFRRIRIGDVVWLLYGPGQMLIVFGAALMMTA